jgi:hypothetical protein
VSRSFHDALMGGQFNRGLIMVTDDHASMDSRR